MKHGLFKFAIRWIRSWPAWNFFVSVVVLWWLHRFPFYQEGLPYLYDLGGSALVAWYIGLGFFTFGLYVVVNGMIVCRCPSNHLQSLFIGGGAFILAGILGWLYLILLELSTGTI